MTRDSYEDITTAEAFNAALSRLLEAGVANGVDVQGAWECPDDGSVPLWDVEVVRLRAREDV